MEFNGSLKHQAVDIEIKEELIEEKDKTCNESIGKFLKMTTMTLFFIHLAILQGVSVQKDMGI